MLFRNLASIALLAAALLPNSALAAIIAQPYAIIPNTLANATQVQSDFSTIYSNVNGNLDASNLASGSGIYASEVIPTSTSQATFGGAYAYTFPATLVIGGGGSGELWQTENGYTVHQYINSSGFLGWYNANTSTSLPIILNLNNGQFLGGSGGVDTVTSPYAWGTNGTYAGGNTTAGFNSNHSASAGGVSSSVVGVTTSSGSTGFALDGSFNLGIGGAYYTPLAVHVGTSGSYTNGYYMGTGYGSYGTVQFSNAPSYPINGINGDLWEVFSNGGTRYFTEDHSGNIAVPGGGNFGSYLNIYGSGLVPYDANATSLSDLATHVEHTTLSYGVVSNGACSTQQWTFQKPFDASPGVTATPQFVPTGGTNITAYVTAVPSTTYAYIAVCNNGVVGVSISAQAIAQGE